MSNMNQIICGWRKRAGGVKKDKIKIKRTRITVLDDYMVFFVK